MDWSFWLLVSIALLLGEAVVPGTIFLVFFSLAGILTAGMSVILPSSSLLSQLLFFAFASLLSITALRPTVLNRLHKEREPKSVKQQRARCITDIRAGQRGRIELQGTTWQAVNIGDTDLRPGDETEVESIEGLTVKVRAF